MNRYLTIDQAAAISRSSPALQVLDVGEKLKYALEIMATPGTTLHVDGTYGDDTNDGQGWDSALKTIQAAVTAVPPGGTVRIRPRAIPITYTDPVSYAENVVIPATKSGIALVGYGTGRTQGGLPQIRPGTGVLPAITVRAPGCLIANLGVNGAGSLGGGILLDDDGASKVAFGTSILNCHFKNCAGHATDGRLGGAINWAATGGAWQILVKGNRFYKNLADMVLLGAGAGVTVQDVVIEDNMFSGPPDFVDVNLWLGGNGITGLVINRNVFGRLPEIAAGSVGRYIDLTGCVGVMHNNVFGCINTLTFRAAAMGTAGRVPATMLMANNWGEDCTTPFVHTA
jgi:hypothetical protein